MLDRSVFLGQSLILQGHVVGHPRPTITWQHPRGHTLVDDGLNIHTYYGDDGTIYLQVSIQKISIEIVNIFLDKVNYSFDLLLCETKTFFFIIKRISIASLGVCIYWQNRYTGKVLT